MSQYSNIENQVLLSGNQIPNQFLGEPPRGNPLGGLATGLANLSEGLASAGAAERRRRLIQQKEAEKAAEKAAEEARKIQEKAFMGVLSMEQEQIKAAEAAAKRDAATYKAQVERMMIQLEINLYNAEGDAEEEASNSDPGLGNQIFDKHMKPIEDQLEGFRDPRDIEGINYLKAKSLFTQHYRRGSDSMGNFSARQMGDASRGSVIKFQGDLLKHVRDGKISYQDAIVSFYERLDELAGTAFTHEQAEKLKISFAEDVAAETANSLIKQASTDLNAVQMLRDYLKSDFAVRHLSEATRHRITTDLDKAEIEAHEYVWTKTFEQYHTFLSSQAITDPDDHLNALYSDKDYLAEQVDAIVAKMLLMKGNKKDMTDAQIREGLLKDAIGNATLTTPKQPKLFEALAYAAQTPTDRGRGFMNYEFGKFIENRREDLYVAVKEETFINEQIKNIELAWASGAFAPELLQYDKAVNAWATKELARTSASRVTDWLTKQNIKIPQVIRDRIKAGFGNAPDDVETREAVEILRIVARNKPDFAARLATDTEQPDAAFVLMNMGYSKARASLLMSHAGQAGMKMGNKLTVATEKELGPDIKRPSLSNALIGYGIDAGVLPPSSAAQEQWRAAYLLSFATATARIGETASVEGAKNHATQAMRDGAFHVLGKFTVVEVSAGIFTLVPSELYNIAPYSNGQDSQANAEFARSMSSRFIRQIPGGLEKMILPPAGMEISRQTFNIFASAYNTAFTENSTPRPDLGFPYGRRGDTYAVYEVIVPIIDNSMGVATRFMAWSPQTGRVVRTIDKGDEFVNLSRYFNEATPETDLDPYSLFRRDTNSDVLYMDEIAEFADPFSKLTLEIFRNLEYHEGTFEDYRENQARSIGYVGFTTPPEEKPK